MKQFVVIFNVIVSTSSKLNALIDCKSSFMLIGIYGREIWNNQNAIVGCDCEVFVLH